MEKENFRAHAAWPRMAIVLSALFLAPAIAVHAADSTRQRDVAKRGAQVMPFDLEQTVHEFRGFRDGGVERVSAKDPKNRVQIELIRTHLKEEAQRFSRGDYSDPASIHGNQMPGLAELSQGAARIKIHYAELPDGAEIRFTTNDPALIDAIHRWFRAQISDHGEHAKPDSHR